MGAINTIRRLGTELPCVNSRRLGRIGRAGHIATIVLAGIGDRLADVGEGRELYDGRKLVGRDDLVVPRTIHNVAAFERPPIDGPVVTVNEALTGHRKKSFARQRIAGMRADVAAAP